MFYIRPAKAKVKWTYFFWVATEDSHCYELGQNNGWKNIIEIFSKSKGLLPLKTMFRYGLLEYCNHFQSCLGSVGDFDDDV